MSKVSLGADLVGPDRLPCVTLSKLFAALAAPPFDWITTDAKGVCLDIARAVEGRALSLPVDHVAAHETAILGGAVKAQDLASAGSAARQLRRAIEERLDVLGLRADTESRLPAPSTSPRVVRYTRASFESLSSSRKHNALVVLGTREEFPHRQALCATLERAVRRTLGHDVADRFEEHLPWRDDVAPLRRSTPRRYMEDFLRFLQEYGMARVRTRVALAWFDALARALPPDRRALAVRYVQALEGITEAASLGTLFPESATVERLGSIHPLRWASTEFVSRLPLVPRADCEYAERTDDDAGLRLGPEASREHEGASGRREPVRVRHVTWLPRFNASGPDLVDHGPGRRLRTTTLGSRALLLERALADGVLDGRGALDPARAARLLRALEHHLVMRAVVLAARDPDANPRARAPELASKMLELLQDRSKGARAVERIAQGYRSPQGGREAIEPVVEALSDAFARHAGQSVPRAHTLEFRLVVDDTVFEARSASPLVASRRQGDPGAGPAWAWMQRLRVVDGASDAPSALSLRVAVALEPRVLRWAQGKEVRDATRGDTGPIVVALHQLQDDARAQVMESLLAESLDLARRDVTVVLPRVPGGSERYEPDRGGLDARARPRVVAATILARTALEAVCCRLAPDRARGVRMVSLFDESRDARDTTDDAVLRAIERALTGSLPGRPIVSQGVVLAGVTDDTDHAKRRRAGTFRALHRGDTVSFGALRAPRHAVPVGLIVLAGRPIDCIRERSGVPVEEMGRDLLWGSAYLASFDEGCVRVADRGRLGAILRVADEWPAGVVRALDDFRAAGCSHVALVTHRAYERSTWRGESRNRIYDGDLPLDLLAKLPQCEGLTLAGMICDTVTAIAADALDGTHPQDGRLLVADGAGLYPDGVSHAVRPIVAVATNRALKLVLDARPDGTRRVGLRRRIHLYVERGAGGTSALAGDAEGRIADALVGLHLLEAESEHGDGKDRAPVLTPRLLPHRVFEVVRRVDAAEILFHEGHARTWVNLLGFAATARSFTQEGER